LTQFNTESLHRHIHNTYRFDNFSQGYIRILAAQQTAESQDWYQGTADAVRKNLQFLTSAGENVIILSGDHLYRMDYRDFYNRHREKEADISIAVKPIYEHEAREFGILKTDSKSKITDFFEKPNEQKTLDEFKINTDLFKQFDIEAKERTHVASMGIYIFKKKALIDILNSSKMEDFGKEIIPDSLSKYKVFSYFFDGYWRDIGSISSFFEAHMDLTNPVPEFNFYDEDFPFYTRPRYLPASKINNCHINHATVSEGSIILGSIVEQAVVGIRAYIDEGTLVQRAYIMGNTHYETVKERQKNTNRPNLGIGKNCVIKNSIIDMDVRIGNNVQLINRENVTEKFEKNYAIRDGIIIVPKGAVIESNTVI
ncbi:MAG: glucose-1-phosphate adenylyltransferase, partial [Calditrichia bacterium]|nr:glucose-1-phosphate adenylyltransferase [Calditrichia bacterium]